jgi:hypothetical protein
MVPPGWIEATKNASLLEAFCFQRYRLPSIHFAACHGVDVFSLFIELQKKHCILWGGARFENNQVLVGLVIAGLPPVGTAKNKRKNRPKKSVFCCLFTNFRVKTGVKNTYAPRIPLLGIF